MQNSTYNRKNTPKRLFIVTISTVFIAEALIMVLLSSLPDLGYLATIFIDATLIVLLVLPVLYFSLFRPLQASFYDISEKEAKLRLLADNTNDWEYLIGKDGKYIYISPTCESVTGYSPEEFKSDPNLLYNIIREDYSEKISNHYSNANVSEAPNYCTEFPIIKKDGEECWIEHSCLSVFDRNGIYIGRRGNNRNITKRKITETALSKSEELYRLTFETASYLITSVNAEGIIVGCNKRIEDFLGYKQGEILGQSYTKIIHENFHDSASDTLSKLVQTGETQEKDYQMIHKDGSIVDVMMSSSSITDNKGVFLRTICIISDTTQQIKANIDLKYSEENLRTLVDSINVIPWRLDLQSLMFTFIGNQVEEILGFPVETWTDLDSWASRIHPEDRQTAVDYCMSSTKKGEDHNFEYRCITSNGEIVWLNDIVTVRKDKNDKPFELLGFMLDITESKKAEEENALLSRAIEQADETIIITDSKGKIEFVNPAFERTSGYSKDEVLGKNPNILKSGIHNDLFYKNLWVTLSSGNQWQGELINKKKDGSLYYENATISPIFNKVGKIVNYVAAKNDITETKRLQEQESRAERLEMAGIIAGQVAHDFNNLLAPIMAYPEFIRDELPEDNPAQRYLSIIEKAAQKITDINQDLLTMGRRGHFNQEIININNIVYHAIDEIRSRAQDVILKTKASKNLLNIKGGSAQLHRMLSNLLVNSLDAMSNYGEITIKTENYYADEDSIAFGSIPKGEYVKLTVTDNGQGIPENIIQKILDPFFSTKSANKKSGTGLGLSVVDAVVKDHNGFLDLESEIGEGTSFYIYFPITREEVKNNLEIQATGGSEKVLIVDDDEVQRNVTCHLLKKIGYSISTVDSGEEAISILTDETMDIVILDMVMPGGMDGTETYKRILEINQNQKAIIVSGFSESKRVIEAQNLGVGAFIKKPFTKAIIAKAVREELDKQLEIVE